ncbi:MAG: anti-sigma factor family protein [Polyangiales bacterium]
MKCSAIRQCLDAFLDGELDPAAQLDVECHLDQCLECHAQHQMAQAARNLVRAAMPRPSVPDALRQRLWAGLDAADHEATNREAAPARRQTSLAWYRHHAWRYALPMAAASLLLISGGALEPHAPLRVHKSVAAGPPSLEDVVWLHTNDLPADVQAEQKPERITNYFRNKVAFPVRPARFAARDARLVGARLSNVGPRRAAALYYNVDGQRVTVVVFEKGDSEAVQGAARVHLQGREVRYRDIHGHTVPVRRHGTLTYAFTGDLERRALLRLAASARVPF